MHIEWNKVTWYSKLVAIVVFVATFFLGFYLGGEYYTALLAAKLSSEITQPSQGLAPQGNDIVNNVVFACPSGQSIHAVFHTARTVDLTLSDGRSMTLPQAMSADGARYANANESFVFWNKGQGAFIEENGTTTFADCAIAPSGQ